MQYPALRWNLCDFHDHDEVEERDSESTWSAEGFLSETDSLSTLTSCTCRYNFLQYRSLFLTCSLWNRHPKFSTLLHTDHMMTSILLSEYDLEDFSSVCNRDIMLIFFKFSAALMSWCWTHLFYDNFLNVYH